MHFNVAQDPWGEFMREEEFNAEDPNHERINETGGKIHFSAALKQISADRKKSSLADYKIELNPVELGTSCSFARRYGSRSFLRLKLNRGLIQADAYILLDFLRKPIILCNSVYRAFYGKEQTVFFFKTNERWDAAKAVIRQDETSLGLGLKEFLDWHNPMVGKNIRQVIEFIDMLDSVCHFFQTMAKWAARFALGLSSSVHGITLDERDINIIEDISQSAI